jgi:hypothetical protein
MPEFGRELSLSIMRSIGPAAADIAANHGPKSIVESRDTLRAWISSDG